MKKISEFDSGAMGMTADFMHDTKETDKPEPAFGKEHKMLSVSERKAELQRFAELFAKSSKQKGVFEVKYSDFETVLELASRFTKRNEQELQLIMFSLLCINEEFENEGLIEETAMVLAEAISNSLRRVDISVRLSKTQYLVALVDTKEEYISVVTDKIVQGFYMKYRGVDFVLDYDIAKINRE